MTAPSPAPGTMLQLTRVFPGSRHDVYRAWTDPDLFRQWFSPPGGSSPSAEMDVRVGGDYRIAMQSPVGITAYVVGTYLEVEPPDRLVYTFGWEGLPVDPGGGQVTVEFRDHGDSTEVVLTHERLRDRASRDFHRWGWMSSLDNLADLLGAESRE